MSLGSEIPRQQLEKRLFDQILSKPPKRLHFYANMLIRMEIINLKIWRVYPLQFAIL